MVGAIAGNDIRLFLDAMGGHVYQLVVITFPHKDTFHGPAQRFDISSRKRKDSCEDDEVDPRDTLVRHLVDGPVKVMKSDAEDACQYHLRGTFKVCLYALCSFMSVGALSSILICVRVTPTG